MENLRKGEKYGWSMLSDPLLVMIFKTLEVKDISSCSNVCVNWNIICQDNLLWKHLFRRDFVNRRKRKKHKNKDEIRLKPGAVSWKEEYIRLKDRYPCVRKQTLKGHTDEVLHCAFSHNGSEIASCSKVFFLALLSRRVYFFIISQRLKGYNKLIVFFYLFRIIK